MIGDTSHFSALFIFHRSVDCHPLFRISQGQTKSAQWFYIAISTSSVGSSEALGDHGWAECYAHI
jgi:hypothetical protein